MAARPEDSPETWDMTTLSRPIFLQQYCPVTFDTGPQPSKKTVILERGNDFKASVYYVVVILFAVGNQFLLLIETDKLTEAYSLLLPQDNMKDSFNFSCPFRTIFNIFIELCCYVRADLLCGSVLVAAGWEGLEASRFEFPTASIACELCRLRQVTEPL